MNKNRKWILTTILLTFVLALIFGGVSNIVIENMNIFVAFLVLIVIMSIGIVFDTIGMAIATCDEAPFHAKSAKKQKGAKETIKILKEKEKNTNICNDLMGDICGIISGSLCALIAIKVTTAIKIDLAITSLLFGSIVAAVTVGSKAAGKTIGVKHSEQIMELVGKIVHFFTPIKENKNK